MVVRIKVASIAWERSEDKTGRRLMTSGVGPLLLVTGGADASAREQQLFLLEEYNLNKLRSVWYSFS